MKNLTLSLGILLIILGLASYLGTGSESVTALIPSFFGLTFLILGLLSGKDKIRKYALNLAVVIALLGSAGAAPGIAGLVDILRGEAVQRPVAVYAQTAMFLMCLVYVVRSSRSFIEARMKEKG